MNLIGAVLHDEIYKAAAGAAELGVVVRGLNVHFLERVDVGCELPRSGTVVLLGDVGAVQSELLVALDAPAQNVVIRDVPPAGARIAGGAELSLEKLRAGCGSDEVVYLAAGEREIVEFSGGDDAIAHRGLGVEQ